MASMVSAARRYEASTSPSRRQCASTRMVWRMWSNTTSESHSRNMASGMPTGSASLAGTRGSKWRTAS